ncbi:phosphate transport system regulatory protein PhoU [candidate division WOR-1 bacterium RIFOXYB2_FULL_42_35]|uniref:Phosphate-specific transport system accessory protein PhoU n=1 Tax=candidate division WOR-1 bacterium RIFOXYC2_FULL_41_25 TaxID=1802586 RepID=A0A1F4TQM9_UNCSA|nr:MAG: phosphate transport system regulatory protein PhoU [candidate division WOR-1 bacterium RIFOXYA2_FULL_41_14]OGC25483.1 MAG: phosphate transport system regulatory protein PhoU [candidate division WOR-1 bacterium RIFOXYB2_FULL_42_35]OGC34889.1 MAG: phosphate transport system regulatory protein PhoU [candidate division WOR-1 bacterium RIFOXYC2_FULL_41_25]OGC42134.1 MAG: phosphate transport system regulatory protein PhoU [candidate division WOR-1 bacterium RIFOXYD2_FULL_41_8]
MDKERVFDKEMAELKDMILKMGVMVQGLIHNSIESLKQRNLDLAEQVIKEDKIVDQLELEIDEKCIELIALRQPEASDLRYIMTGTRIVTDLERIGDLAEDIAQRTKVLDGQPFPKPLIDIPKMAKLAQDAVAQVLEAFINRDSNKAKAVWEKEKEIDKLRDQVHDELVELMSKDASTVPTAIPLLLVSRHLERIGDHATNIAEDVIYMVEARVVKHGGVGKAA